MIRVCKTVGREVPSSITVSCPSVVVERDKLAPWPSWQAGTWLIDRDISPVKIE